MHLARPLRVDESGSVAVRSVEQEAARDLVRDREELRSDLMRPRHRVSKLLLRQGIRVIRRQRVDAQACGHAGNQRLHQRWLHFSDSKKKPVVAFALPA